MAPSRTQDDEEPNEELIAEELMAPSRHKEDTG